MYIYIGVFIMSCFLLWTVETQNIRNPFIRKGLVFLALFIPVLLAGMRKIGVGTDTQVYVNLMYDAALNSDSLKEYFNYSVFSVYHYIKISSWEVGFCFLVYIITKIFGSYQMVLFAIEAVIIIFIYKGLKYFKHEVPVWLGMLIFYFMFYNATYNAMRQWVATAILFWGYHYLLEEQTTKYIVTILVAMLFHTSALMGVVIYILYRYSMNGKMRYSLNNGKLDIGLYKILVVTIVGILGLAGLHLISNVLRMFGAEFVRYVLVYLNGTVAFMPMQIIRKLPLALLVFFSWKRLRHRTSQATFLVITTVVIDILVAQLGSITNQSGRIGSYFSVYALLCYPHVLKTYKINRRVVEVIMLIVLTATWYYDYALNGRGETVPYIFYFQ